MLLEGVGVGFFDVFIILITLVPLSAVFIVFATRAFRLGIARYWMSEFAVPLDPINLQATSFRLVLPIRVFVATLAAGLVVVRLFSPPSPSAPYEFLYFWQMSASVHLPALVALIAACIAAVAATGKSRIPDRNPELQELSRRVPWWLQITAFTTLGLAVGILAAAVVAEFVGYIAPSIPFIASPAMIFVVSSAMLLLTGAFARPWITRRKSSSLDPLWNEIFATTALWMLSLTSLYASVTSIGMVLDLVDDTLRQGAPLPWMVSSALSVAAYVFNSLPTVLAIYVFLISPLWGLMSTLKIRVPDLYASSVAAQKAARWRRRTVVATSSDQANAPAEEEPSVR